MIRESAHGSRDSESRPTSGTFRWPGLAPAGKCALASAARACCWPENACGANVQAPVGRARTRPSSGRPESLARWGVEDLQIEPVAKARRCRPESADSNAAPWERAQATMIASAGRSAIPFDRACLASSCAAFETASSIGSSGSILESNRRASRSPRVRTRCQTSSFTSEHQRACPAATAVMTRPRTAGSPYGRIKCSNDEVWTRIMSSVP